jgi:peptide-methionine (S)-S-oxide reductase
MKPGLLPMLAAAAIALAAAGALAQQEGSTMPENGEAVAIFAGGCFWCMEPPYDELDGVIATVSGYTGGSKVDPTYEEVSTGGTGHTEAVRITYDPALDAGGQFCDRGDQYRTGIFVHDEEQRRLAETSKQALTDSGRFQQPIVTEIVAAGPFYPAEDYHQDYYEKNPIRYKFYRWNCGRDAHLTQLWGDAATH